MKTIVAQGDPFDAVYTIDGDDPFLSWNVTRIFADAERGIFGAVEVFPIDGLPPDPNLDHAKVAHFVRNPDLTDRPAVILLWPSKDQWIVRAVLDGNHRIAARKLLGFADFSAWLVPDTMERKYRAFKEVEL